MVFHAFDKEIRCFDYAEHEDYANSTEQNVGAS